MSIVMSAIKSMFEGKAGRVATVTLQCRPMASLCRVFLTNKETGKLENLHSTSVVMLAGRSKIFTFTRNE